MWCASRFVDVLWMWMSDVFGETLWMPIPLCWLLLAVLIPRFLFHFRGDGFLLSDPISIDIQFFVHPTKWPQPIWDETFRLYLGKKRKLLTLTLLYDFRSTTILVKKRKLRKQFVWFPVVKTTTSCLGSFAKKGSASSTSESEGESFARRKFLPWNGWVNCS